jgi:tetratricopeptide (TPR) repeat protein
MDTKALERNIKTIIKTGAGYGPEFRPILKQTKEVLKKINKGKPTAGHYFVLGENLIQLQDHTMAKQAFETGYQLDATHVNCGTYYALLLEQEGQLDEALAVYLELNKLAPHNMQLVERMLLIFYAKGNTEQVLKICQLFLAEGKEYPLIYEYIAQIYFDVGNNLKAAEHMQVAHRLEPDNTVYIERLVLYYFKSEQNQAIIDLMAELSINEQLSTSTLLVVACSLAKVGDLKAARQYYVELLKSRSERFEILAEIALYHIRFEHSLAKCLFINQYILKREPGNIYALTNLALHKSDDFALNAFAKVYSQLPTNPNIKLNYGYNLLRDGQLERGFKFYEARLEVHMKFLTKRISYPSTLEGKKLLVWREQGLGDEILWSWLFQFLEQQNVQAVIQVDPRIQSLMARSFTTLTFISDSSVELLENHDFEQYQAELAHASLGQYYVEQIRQKQLAFEQGDYSTQHLIADAQLAQSWQQKLSTFTANKTVGICWRSGKLDDMRKLYYMDVTQIISLFKDIDCTLVNLQYDYTEQELEQLTSALGDRFIHFDDLNLKDEQENLAALIDSLDMVFTAATAVNSLAGALGKKTLCFDYMGEREQVRWFGKNYNICLPEVSFIGQKNKLIADSMDYYKEQVQKLLVSL